MNFVGSRAKKKLNFTLEGLHQGFRIHNPKDSWMIYNHLINKEPHVLSADDHTTMLSYLTQITHPLLGEAHAARIVWNMRNHGHRLDVRDYTALFTIYLASKNHAKVLETFDNMMALDNRRPDVKAYNSLMASYLHEKKYRKVLETWNECLTFYPASRYLNMDGRSLLIESFTLQNDFESAENLFKDLKLKLKNSKIEIAQCIYEAMIKMYGASNQLSKAESMFNGLDQTQYAYKAILDACIHAKNKTKIDFYWNSLLKMIEKRADSYKHRKAHPLPSIMTKIIEYKANCGEHERVLELFEYHWTMVLPDVETFEICIESLLSLGKVREAIDKYDLMIDRRYIPSSHLIRRIEQLKEETLTAVDL